MATVIPNVTNKEPGFIHDTVASPKKYEVTPMVGCVGALGFTNWGPENLTLISGGMDEFEKVYGDDITGYQTKKYLTYMFNASYYKGEYAPLFFKRVFKYDANGAITATKAVGSIYDGTPTASSIGSPIKTGTDDDTLTTSGSYTGTLNGVYTVEVTTGGSYGTAEISKYFTPVGGIKTLLGTLIPVSGQTYVIENGVSFEITDGGDTSLTNGTKWEIAVTAAGKSTGDVRIEVEGKYYGSLGNRVSVKAVSPDNGITGDFGIEVYLDGVKKESYQDLSVDVNSSNYFEKVVNTQSNYIVLKDTNNIQDVGIDTTTGVGNYLINGSNGDTPVLADYLGNKTLSTGIHGFSETRVPLRIINPDAIIGKIDYVQFVRGLNNYIKNDNSRCSQHILVPKNLVDYSGIESWFNNTVQMDSEYSFMYFGFVRDRNTGEYVDPTASITGLSSKVARDSGAYGVWTNYAGEEFVLEDFDAVHKSFTSDVNGKLNELGINVIKFTSGVGVFMNGCRTMTKTNKKLYKYISTVLNTQDCDYMLEEGLRWVKFKNLSDSLYTAIKDSANAILAKRNKEGGFNTEDGNPYEVRCSTSNQTEEYKNKGIVLVEWGIRNRYCAEFTWMKFTNMTAGASI